MFARFLGHCVAAVLANGGLFLWNRDFFRLGRCDVGHVAGVVDVCLIGYVLGEEKCELVRACLGDCVGSEGVGARFEIAVLKVASRYV